jgi:hypothetical protein
LRSGKPPFSKLDITSRAQLAAQVVGERQQEPPPAQTTTGT